MKLNLEKVKPLFEKAKALYRRRMFRYLSIAAGGIILILAGVLIEHYGVRRWFGNKPVQYNIRNNNPLESVYGARLLVDERVFLEKISALFDPKVVYDTYRQGLHSFSLTVFVSKSNKVVQHHFKWWDGSSYLSANYFIDSLKFEQVLNTIPFSNGKNFLAEDFKSRVDFYLRIGISKDGKLVQPLMLTEQNGEKYETIYDKYITKNDIMNKKGIYVDLSDEDISQYTYKKARSKPDTAPVPINHQKVFDEKLVYPEKAKEMEIEGRVVLRVLVNEAGKVVAVRIDKGLGGGCDEAAVKAAFDVLYKPAILNGKPVKSSAVLPVIFKL